MSGQWARLNVGQAGHAAGLLLCALCLAVPGRAPAQAPAYRFASPPGAAASPLGPQVLSAEEQAFIKSLPEVRVGLALPAPRPYERISDSGEITGIHPDMLASLARAFGLRLKPVVLPNWSSLLDAAKRREVDLVMTLGVTAERSEFLQFTLGATPMPGALFTRKTSPGAVPPQPLPLERARFVVERAFLAADFIQRQYPEARLTMVETTGDALRVLADGGADYYLGSLLEAVDWLARNRLPEVEVQRLMNYGTGYYHFAVRKDWAPLAGILNKGISTLRATPSPTLAETTAAAGLPTSMLPPPPRPLSPAEGAVLAQRAVWRVGAVRGLALLNDVDDKGQHSGIGAEYTQAVARALGVAVQVVPFDNVAAMLDALRAGSIDIAPFLTLTAERQRDFGFSAPYVEMPYMIVARADAPLYWDLHSLRGRRVALALQHPLRELLAQRYPDVQIVDAANGDEAMNMVARGQADAAVEVKLFANLRINSDNDGTLRTVAVVDELPAQFRFAASRQALALIPIIDEVLGEIPPAERLRMLRRWVARDLDPAFPWRRYLPALGVAGAALLMLVLGTWWWMRRLQREVQARRVSEERLRDIGATLPCLAFRYEVDAASRVVTTYFSEGAPSLLGIALEPGRTVLENLGPRMHADQREVAEQAQRNSLQSGARFKMSAAYDHPDGRPRWLHAEAVSRPREGGGSTWTGYVVDVTAERDLQQWVVHEAQARNLLLASASHELRAPTHTLTLALQTLAEGGQGLSAAAPLAVAQDAARTLTELLNDVLDAARLDHGEMRLNPQQVVLRDLVGRLADSTRPWAAGKGLVFDLQVDASAPSLVRLDPMRLRQMLTNLLSNAIKYTAAGHVGLHVAATPQTLTFTVSDSGRGIEPARLERLFTPFAADAGGGGAPEPGGSSGLGLSICRRIATLMGGSVDLHSQPDRGTQAVLSIPLPVQAVAQEHGTAETAGAPGAAGVGALPAPPGAVLVCDDDDTSRVLLAHMLSSRGYSVVECADGAQALARWKQGGVQAVVTDLHMAGMDGNEFLEALRAAENGSTARKPRTPVVVCSGSSMPMPLAGSPGALHDAYLEKPLSVHALVETLESIGVRAGAGG